MVFVAVCLIRIGSSSSIFCFTAASSLVRGAFTGIRSCCFCFGFFEAKLHFTSSWKTSVSALLRRHKPFAARISCGNGGRRVVRVFAFFSC